MTRLFKRFPLKILTIRLLSVLFLTLFLITPLSAISFTGNSGYYFPIGSWSSNHNSAPYIALGTNLFEKDYLTCGISFDVSSFSGKLNNSYNLQIFSPGATIKFYPFFFTKNYNLFTSGTISYGFMQKTLHNSTENGNDYCILALIGVELMMTKNWFISSSLGEKHFTGGIDMLTFGIGLEFRK